MSPEVYAFINGEMVVVNVITGSLTEEQLRRFESDYGILFGSTQSVRVASGRPVWIGGSYDPSSGDFSPPPSPEPEPTVEEIVNDDAPIE